jgi:triacylglycerol lipase
MGGLDARYLVSTLGYGDRVASLTTISSPHRGSGVADAALKVLPGFADPLINRLGELWGTTFNELADGNTDVAGALEDLSVAASPAFNRANKDVPGVYYQSWAGVSSAFGLVKESAWAACEGKTLRHPGTADRLHATLLPMALLTGGRGNDGMATVESAKLGRFRGCFPGDHLDEVGQPKRTGPDRGTGFDHVRFYRNLAYDLAAQGY